MGGLVMKLFFLILCSLFASVRADYLIVNSIPKCGTHLLVSAVEKLFDMTGYNTLGHKWVKQDKMPAITAKQFPFFHIPFSPSYLEAALKRRFSMILISRDPRDQVISHAYFLIRYPHYAKDTYKPYLKDHSELDKLISHMIIDIEELYDDYLGWLGYDFVLPVAFEDLVGPLGGGDRERQLETLKRIGQHMYKTIDDMKLELVADSIFGNTATFREGKIGGWRLLLTKEHKELFKIYGGNLIIRLGYEVDTNW